MNEQDENAQDATTAAAPAPSAELKAIIEALIFASPEPITPRQLFRMIAEEPKEDVKAAIESLRADYDNRPGLQLIEVAGGYQITTTRAPRVGAPAVPRTLHAEADGAGARDTRGHRL